MEVDENYDDSGDEEKRVGSKQENQRESPKTTNAPSPAAVESQA
jgi:hypothetical protein